MTPVTTLAVVFDLGVRLQAEPRRKGLVLLVLDTQGALGPETLLAGHLDILTPTRKSTKDHRSRCGYLSISWSSEGGPKAPGNGQWK